mmetsp:Transcript_25908/g.60608  ORF Transcript_25908/g.60608 Transcript_25908/m.60608 type:complete len:648 (+) Transcript_25908:65-2008(+)|eukprot:CAMPEP_0182561226 /NCGR_PEP_ID=MMETSP1324-20130603/3738_1 /TAXON_ID=236786 /ORGANISM="Florenciella sp., Strain RCC1587" /LENGTH=647 /DNA_ID=CAMNT_0024773787 /DNA_START=97 /DNA_END=2040 /DNA_ORIENTATION=+
MTDIADGVDAVDLKISGVIGFTGEVANGLFYSPCGGFVVYPLGSIIVVKDVATNAQTFLEGHSNDVTCISISHDGSKIASGQMNNPGMRADVLIWDLDTAKSNCMSDSPVACPPIFRLEQHLGRVQDVDFSCDDQYLCTLGGQDDNALVIWEVETGTAICGSPAAQDSAYSARWLKNRNDRLVTAGNYHLRVWQVDVGMPKLHAMDAKMGTMKRVIQCIDVTDDDEFAYCGTKTGELLKFKIDRDPIQSFNDPDRVRPTLKAYTKERFGKGVKSCKVWNNPSTGNTNIIIGAGDGTVALISEKLNVVKGYRAQVMGAVTSITMSPDGAGFMVGTDQSNRYYVTMAWDVELRATCHCGPVNDICFPSGCSDLFITCSIYDIRIWNSALRQELLRIQVPNLECKCIGITPNGQTIVSGWTDGKIRAFFPESGRLKFVISDAHSEAVTALAVCNDDETRPPWRIVSGGDDGRVRVWNVTSSHQQLLHSMKEHRSTVHCIRVSADNSQCVSASADGSCIVWDLQRYVRLLALFEPTVFQSVLYHPDESQILTCGENHKISYWDASNGQAIRVVGGSNKEMTSLDVDPIGDRFVSGSADKLVKVWHYDDGISTAIGSGHSGKITAVKISPDQSTIVSVGEEGAIFLWDMANP